MPRRRPWLRSVLLLLALLLLGVLLFPSAMSCVMPGPASDDPSLAALQRDAVSAVTGRVSYLRAGDPDGPRLIYVHGTPGDAGAWADYLVDPMAGWEAVALDRPGFGESEPEAAVASLARQAAAIAPLLVERHGRWPILIGHSLGGPIIARVAVDYQDRVGGLVIAAGSIDPELEELRWYNHIGSMIEPVLSRPMRNCNQELASLKAELEELRELLPRLICPVVIVHGTADTLVPYANVDYMQREFTHAASVELIALQNGDHFLPWDAAGTLREAIERLVRGGER